MSGTTSAPTRRQLSAWLIQQARPTLTPLALSAAMRVLGYVAQAALFGLAGWAIGTVASGGSIDLAALLWVAVAIIVIKGTARYLEQYCDHVVAFTALAGLRTQFFHHLAPQAPSVFLRRRTGDLLSRVTKDIDRIEVFFAHTLVPLATAVLLPVAAACWLAYAVHPVVAVVNLTGWALLVAGIPWLGTRSVRASAQRVRVWRGDLAQELTDTVQGIREVLAFDAQQWRRDAVAHVDENIARELRSMSRVAAVRHGAYVGVQLALPVATILTGAALAIHGGIDIPQLCMALGVTLGVTPAALAAEELGGVLDEAFAAAGRVREVIEDAPATPEPDQPVPAPAAPVAVHLEQVAFAYPSRSAGTGDVTPVVDGVDIEIPAGGCVGLVGASGAGKSTLAALLARVVDPDRGRVSVGGVDLRDISDRDLRRLIGVVPQQPWIFSGTIADNLRLASPNASDADLVAVCAQARLQDLVPDASALTRSVGERGDRLSGGQRQRLAIAQVLLRGTPVLVFDEITSQLDESTERELMETIRDVARGRTTLVIAHRLSTVGWVNRLIVLDRGHIVQSGAPAALAAQDGPYRRLLEVQGGIDIMGRGERT